jgi:diacylglycerol kinase family enzyme
MKESGAGAGNQVRRLSQMAPAEEAISIDHVAFIVNPHSGGGGGDRVFLWVAEQLRRHDITIAAFETTRTGGALPATEAALRAGFTEIWVIGGDGTIQEALRPIVEAGAVLGPLPGGTGNRLVVEVGHAPDDPVAQALWMMRQPVSEIDVGECNGHLFTGRLGVGFEAAAAEEVEDEKSGLGNFSYLIAGLRAARDIRPKHLTLTTGDETVYDGPMLAAMITNLPIRMLVKVPGFSSSGPVDGALQTIILRERPGLDALWRWIRGGEEPSPSEEVFEHSAPAYHVAVEGGAPVHLDGEVVGTLEEFDARCHPRGLRLRGLHLRATTSDGEDPPNGRQNASAEDEAAQR